MFIKEHQHQKILNLEKSYRTYELDIQKRRDTIQKMAQILAHHVSQTISNTFGDFRLLEMAEHDAHRQVIEDQRRANAELNIPRMYEANLLAGAINANHGLTDPNMISPQFMGNFAPNNPGNLLGMNYMQPNIMPNIQQPGTINPMGVPGMNNYQDINSNIADNTMPGFIDPNSYKKSKKNGEEEYLIKTEK